jgi:predicted Zn-dependent protease
MPSRSEHFRGLVSSQPNNELFHFSLAQALVAEGNAAEAELHYRFCTEKKVDWMMPRILLGKLLVSLGRMPEARLHLQAALQLAVDQHHETPEAELRALLSSLD